MVTVKDDHANHDDIRRYTKLDAFVRDVRAHEVCHVCRVLQDKVWVLPQIYPNEWFCVFCMFNKTQDLGYDACTLCRAANSGGLLFVKPKEHK